MAEPTAIFFMQIEKDQKTAILLGATGLVGNELLHQLLAHPAYGKVIALTRRPLEIKHKNLEPHVIDFDKPETYASLLKGEDLFCALGTTMKQAGSREAFFKVDFSYTMDAARAARKNGTAQFLLVSSVGANAHALFFYPRVKGELENALKKLDFWALHLFRPSVLLGKRNDARAGEEITGMAMRGLDRITGGNLLGSYRPIDAATVARGMLTAAQRLEAGIYEYPSHQIHKLAEEKQQWITKQ